MRFLRAVKEIGLVLVEKITVTMAGVRTTTLTLFIAPLRLQQTTHSAAAATTTTARATRTTTIAAAAASSALRLARWTRSRSDPFARSSPT